MAGVFCFEIRLPRDLELLKVKGFFFFFVEFCFSLVFQVPRGGHDFLKATAVRAEGGDKPDL